MCSAKQPSPSREGKQSVATMEQLCDSALGPVCPPGVHWRFLPSPVVGTLAMLLYFLPRPSTWETWSFCCGDPCSDDYLIAKGDYTHAQFTDCTTLHQAHAYYYLECVSNCDDNIELWYEVVMYESATCFSPRTLIWANCSQVDVWRVLGSRTL